MKRNKFDGIKLPFVGVGHMYTKALKATEEVMKAFILAAKVSLKE